MRKTPVRQLSPWTQSLIPQILEMHNSGMNPTAISKALPESPTGQKTSKDTVKRVLDKQNISVNVRNCTTKADLYADFERRLKAGEIYTRLIKEMKLDRTKCRAIADKLGIEIGLSTSGTAHRIFTPAEVMEKLNDPTCKYLGFKDGYYHFEDEKGRPFKKSVARIWQGSPYGKSGKIWTKPELEQLIGSQGYTLNSDFSRMRDQVEVICKNGHIRKTKAERIVKDGCDECHKESLFGMTRAEREQKLDEIMEILRNKEDAVGNLSKKHGIPPGTIHKEARRRGIQLPTQFSAQEVEVRDFIMSLGLTEDQLVFNSRKIIPPLEIDIFIPHLKLGIEYCGMYWHSEQFVTETSKKYGKADTKSHYNKMKACEEEGVRLITIFENEWLERPKQCQNFLKSVIGGQERIYARKTKVVEIDKKTAIKFLEDTHIQGGTTQTDLQVGLQYNGELVGVMTFGKHHRKTDSGKVSVLNRMSFKDGLTVVGGASKMLEFAKNKLKKSGYEKIISWSDNRWSQGLAYVSMGFHLEDELGIDYCYFDLHTMTVKSKQSCQKYALRAKGAIGNTEHEMALSLDLYRMYDCGKKRWAIHL